MARFDERRTERSPRHPDWDYERELRRMRSRHEEEQERSGRGYYGGAERWSEDGRRFGTGSGSDYETDYPRRGEGWGGSQEEFGRGQYGPYGEGGRGQEFPDYGRSGRYSYAGREDYGRSSGSGQGYGRGQESRWQSGSGQSQGWIGGDIDESGRGESHAGKGPKGFSRSPERLKDKVCERLEDAHEIDASEIEVTVESQGEITLEGTVRDRWQKQAAERCAESVRGVRDVHNRLRVKQQEGSGRQGSAGASTGMSGSLGSSTGTSSGTTSKKSGSF